MVGTKSNDVHLQILSDVPLAGAPERAARLGIDYRKGQTGMVNTANGLAPVYRVQLNTVRIGDIELTQVDASVHESGLSFALLGMSFLNRTEMRREGQQMTLTKRY